MIKSIDAAIMTSDGKVKKYEEMLATLDEAIKQAAAKGENWCWISLDEREIETRWFKPPRLSGIAKLLDGQARVAGYKTSVQRGYTDIFDNMPTRLVLTW